jgi:hypothetical protein
VVKAPCLPVRLSDTRVYACLPAHSLKARSLEQRIPLWITLNTRSCERYYVPHPEGLPNCIRPRRFHHEMREEDEKHDEKECQMPALRGSFLVSGRGRSRTYCKPAHGERRGAPQPNSEYRS